MAQINIPSVWPDSKEIIAAMDSLSKIKKCACCGKPVKGNPYSIILVGGKGEKPKARPIKFCSEKCMERWDKSS